MPVQSLLPGHALVACLSVLAAAVPLAAEPGTPDSNPHVWNSSVKSVAVFKDGYGFFMREGDVLLRDGWCASGPVPPAVFGTFAVYSHAEDQTVDIVGSGPGEIIAFDDIDVSDSDAARRERLESLRQLEVEIVYRHRGTEHVAAGRLVSVESRDVILEDEASRYALPLSGITQVQVLDLPLRVHVEGPSGSATGTSTLGMAYLRGGITWIPEYTLRVLDDDTAELTLRGTLVNEAEDIIHGDVHFVVGVPHFVHTDLLTPIAVGQVIRTIGAAVAPVQLRGQIMSRSGIASNAEGAPQLYGPAAAGAVDVPVGHDGAHLGSATGALPMMKTSAAADYTTYTKRDLTVRRGEKAIVTLFTKRIRFSHRYRWAPPERLRHLLVLHNDTDSAWTTGPALAVSGPQPLGEDLLKYTPRGGECEFPVTTAVNITHDREERETDRKLKRHEPSHNYFLDLVTLAGELKIRNFEARPIRVLIDLPTPGKPLSASRGGVTSIDSTLLRLTERSGSIRWDVHLEPDEAVTLEYSYERYVPSK